MKKKAIILTLLTALSASVNVNALTNGMGLTVTDVNTHEGGGYLTFSTNLGGSNLCPSGGPSNMLAFSNNEDGKAFLSVGLLALTTGKTVDVYSKTTCPAHQGNVENLSSININQ